MKVGDLFSVVDGTSEFDGMHRILWINRESDLIVTIDVPVLIPKPDKLYFRAPERRSLTGIESSFAAGDLQPGTLRLPGVLLMNDEEIRVRYPHWRNLKSSPLEVRNKYTEALRPIIHAIDKDKQKFFEANGMLKAIKTVVSSGALNRNQVYSAVHRYLAIAIGQNALLPLRYCCGGPGKEREQTSRLGNTSAAFKAGQTDDQGFALSKEDKKNMACGWSAFINGRNSTEDAYNLTMAVYYADGTHVKDGVELPTLLSPEKRPTLSQFKRWGPMPKGNKEAWEALLGRNQWEMEYRALLGTALDSTTAAGQLAMCDATSADRHLVTGVSRLRPIGSAVQLIIQDVFSSIISGVYLGLDAPSGEIALLTVLDSATSNVDTCRRFGVDIEPDDIPAIFYATFLVDNGEFRTDHVIKTLTALGANIELTATYHGDLKGQVESTHRSLHKLESHKTSGTTRGRQRKRGEEAPGVEACWRFEEAMRLRLQAIKYYNTQMRVEKFFNQHPLASAMRRDGVPPIRKAIYQWCVNNGYIASRPCNVDQLRAALLPSWNAVVRENGIFLLRPDRGDKVEIMYPHRFHGPRAAELKWLEKARRGSTFRIKVRVEPNSLQRIWYVDDQGIHEFTNLASDIDFVSTATVADSLCVQDENVENRGLSREETEQARTDFVAGRTMADDQYRREKQKEIADQEKPPTKTSMTADVRGNRAEEKDRLAANQNPEPDSPIAPEPVEDAVDDVPTYADSILDKHRHG